MPKVAEIARRSASNNLRKYQENSAMQPSLPIGGFQESNRISPSPPPKKNKTKQNKNKNKQKQHLIKIIPYLFHQMNFRNTVHNYLVSKILDAL